MRTKFFFVVVFSIIVAFIVKNYLFDTIYVPAEVLEPQLIEGDYAALNRVAYGYKFPWGKEKFYKGDSIKKGDVVVVVNPDNGKEYLRKVSALSGDVLDRKVAIPENSVLVETQSVSKYSKFIVPNKNILGRVDFVIMSIPKRKKGEKRVFWIGDRFLKSLKWIG